MGHPGMRTRALCLTGEHISSPFTATSWLGFGGLLPTPPPLTWSPALKSTFLHHWSGVLGPAHPAGLECLWWGNQDPAKKQLEQTWPTLQTPPSQLLKAVLVSVLG